MSELVEIARALRDLQKQVAALQRLEQGSGGGGGLDFDDIDGLSALGAAPELADEFAIYDVDATGAKKVTTQEVWDSLAELEDVSIFDTTDPIPLYSTNTGKTEKLPVWGVYYLISSLADNPTTIDPATDYFLLKSAGFNIYKVSVSDILDSIKTIDGSGSGLDADTVDGAHYEEGSWTPALTFGGGSTGITYGAANAGRYERIGNIVNFSGRLFLTNKGSSTGDAVITGLPITIANGDSFTTPISTFVTNLTLTANYQLSGLALNNTTTIALYQAISGGVAAVTNTHFNNNTSIYLRGSYRAA